MNARNSIRASTALVAIVLLPLALTVPDGAAIAPGLKDALATSAK